VHADEDGTRRNIHPHYSPVEALKNRIVGALLSAANYKFTQLEKWKYLTRSATCQDLEKSETCQYLIGPPLFSISAAIRRGHEAYLLPQPTRMKMHIR